VPPLKTLLDLLARQATDLRLNVFELPLQLPELDIAVAFHPRAMSDPAIIWLMDSIRGDAGRASVSEGLRIRSRSR
jgi:hypothetical protein